MVIENKWLTYRSFILKSFLDCGTGVQNKSRRSAAGFLGWRGRLEVLYCCFICG